MIKTDTLSRSDMTNSESAAFDTLPTNLQRCLKRAVNKGSVPLPSGTKAEIGRDWLMVPTRKGYRQVVITDTRAFVI